MELEENLSPQVTQANILSHLHVESNANLKIGDITVIFKQIQLIAKSEELKSEDATKLIGLIRDYLTLHYLDERFSSLRLLDKKIPLTPTLINNLVIIDKPTYEHLDGQAIEKSKLVKNSFDTKNIQTSEDIYRHYEKERIEIKDIFKQREKDSESPRRILIHGRAGIGKTTLCQQIVHEWAHKRLWQDKFEWIILFSLREFNQKIEGYGTRLGDMLNAMVFSRSGFTGDCAVETLHQLIHIHLKEKVLFILDGYDEFNQDSPFNHVIKDLLSNHNLAHVIMTSRPFYSSQHTFQRTLEVTGFSKIEIDRYVQSFFDKDQRSYKNLKNWFEKNPNILNLVHTPILLGLICYLWSDSKLVQTLNQKISMTFTELYSHLVNYLWEKYIEKHAPAVKSKERKSFNKRKKLLNEFFEQLAFATMQEDKVTFDVTTLCKIGFQIFKDSEGLGKLNDFKDYIGSILEPGFLYKQGIGYRTSEMYYFLHRTFQEFFAAKYWVRCFTNVQQSNEAIQFFQSNKYHSRFEIVWWFAAGLCHMDENPSDNNLLQRFANLLMDLPRDIVGIKDTSLIIRCLEESNLALDLTSTKLLILQIKEWFKINIPLQRGGEAMRQHLILDLAFSHNVFQKYCKQPLLNELKGHGLIDALDILIKIGYLDNDIIQVLLELLNNSNSYVKERAIEAVAKINSSNDNVNEVASSLINKLLNDNEVNAKAAAALGKLGYQDDKVISALTAILRQQPDDHVLEEAINAIGNLDLEPSKIEEFNIIELIVNILQNKYISGNIRKVAAERFVMWGKHNIKAIENTIKPLYSNNEKSTDYDSAVAPAEEISSYVGRVLKGVKKSFGQTVFSKPFKLGLFRHLSAGAAGYSAIFIIKALKQLDHPNKNITQALIEIVTENSIHNTQEAAEETLYYWCQKNQETCLILIDSLHKNNKLLIKLLARLINEENSYLETPLINILKNGHLNEQNKVLKVLQAVNNLSAGLLSTLIGIIDNNNSEIKLKQKVAILLSQKNYPTDKRSCLISILISEFQNNRRIDGTVEALIKLECKDSNFINLLIKLLEDKNNKVQMDAALVLTELHYPSNTKSLIYDHCIKKFNKETPSYELRQIIKLLTSFENITQKSNSYLIEFLEDDLRKGNFDTKFEAAKLLSKINYPKDKIIKSLNDSLRNFNSEIPKITNLIFEIGKSIYQENSYENPFNESIDIILKLIDEDNNKREKWFYTKELSIYEMVNALINFKYSHEKMVGFLIRMINNGEYDITEIIQSLSQINERQVRPTIPIICNLVTDHNVYDENFCFVTILIFERLIFNFNQSDLIDEQLIQALFLIMTRNYIPLIQRRCINLLSRLPEEKYIILINLLNKENLHQNYGIVQKGSLAQFAKFDGKFLDQLIDEYLKNPTVLSLTFLILEAIDLSPCIDKFNIVKSRAQLNFRFSDTDTIALFRNTNTIALFDAYIKTANPLFLYAVHAKCYSTDVISLIIDETNIFLFKDNEHFPYKTREELLVYFDIFKNFPREIKQTGNTNQRIETQLQDKHAVSTTYSQILSSQIGSSDISGAKNNLESRKPIQVSHQIKAPSTQYQKQNYQEVKTKAQNLSDLKISDPGYWYSDGDINKLLTLMVTDSGEANILSAPHDNENFIQIIKHAIDDWQGPITEKGTINFTLPSLLPLNINFEKQEIEKNQNNHWVGLFIEPNANVYDITYVDAKGKSIPDFIKAQIESIFKEKLGQIISKSEEQQQNDSDCGAFLVENLICLLDKRGLSTPLDGNARDIRHKHAELLSSLNNISSAKTSI